jgi:Kef-type K+ transport system membrane component KefB
VHSDPVAAVVLLLAVILVAAKLGGDVAVRLGQPSVLGELLAGVVLGNLGLLGFHGFDAVAGNGDVDLLSRLGVLILLFDVGLESTVGQMMGVGLSALLVAMLGVAAPLLLGWLVGAWLLPDAGPYLHAFLGATLCATSIGITARVLQDLGRSQSREARIILGAAVVDDVLGLVVLSVVAGVIGAAAGGASLSYGSIAWIIAKAALFLAGAVVIGLRLSPRLFRFGARLRSRDVLLTFGLAFCFALAWLSDLVGLAPIVGAFAAGLILEDVHFRGLVDRGERPLREAIHPITAFLAPLFFVVMGMRTQLASFFDARVVLLTLALTIAAIAGKQVCGLGVLGGGVDRLSVGLGMVPRGEVGLIFANIGLMLSVGEHPLLDATTYSAIVAMVILTTLVTPPALKWSFGRGRHAARAA